MHSDVWRGTGWSADSASVFKIPAVTREPYGDNAHQVIAKKRDDGVSRKSKSDKWAQARFAAQDRIGYRDPSRGSGLQKELADHPHVRPVILEFVAAIEADNVMLAGGRWHVPVRIHSTPHGHRSGSGERLRKFFMRAANRQ